MNLLEISDLTKSYGRSCGIDGLNLTVSGGDLF